MKESAVFFGKTQSLVGIITDPPETVRTNNLPAILFLNNGLIHRVGPNRLYVKMARHVAAMGCVAMRFDFSGVGDSEVLHENLLFEKRTVCETQDAMSFLGATRGIERFILIGNCSGGEVALKTACCDPRVVGAVLINTQGYRHDFSVYIRNRSAARYYWKGALWTPKSWLRVLKGKTDYWNVIRVIGFQLRSLFVRKSYVPSRVEDIVGTLRSLVERGIRLLLVYSQWDEGLDYLRMTLGEGIHELSACGTARLVIIQGGSRTFMQLCSQEHLLQVIHKWVETMVQDAQSG